MALLELKDFCAGLKDKDIIKNLNFTVEPGQVHAIMGPNGSGKSTLSHVLAGKSPYEVKSGTMHLGAKDLASLNPQERAQAGLFLAFQYPVELPGVNNAYFLRAAMNSILKANGLEEIDALSFLKEAKKAMALLGMKEGFLNRNVNQGFSGGEKKRNEILQMMLLRPKLAILDETDSGLDIDALQMVAKGVNHMRAKDRSFVVITHYKRLLDYIKPDFVHVLSDGQIVKSGGFELANELEEKGYAWLEGQD